MSNERLVRSCSLAERIETAKASARDHVSVSATQSLGRRDLRDDCIKRRCPSLVCRRLALSPPCEKNWTAAEKASSPSPLLRSLSLILIAEAASVPLGVIKATKTNETGPDRGWGPHPFSIHFSLILLPSPFLSPQAPSTHRLLLLSSLSPALKLFINMECAGEGGGAGAATAAPAAAAAAAAPGANDASFFPGRREGGDSGKKLGDLDDGSLFSFFTSGKKTSATTKKIP